MSNATAESRNATSSAGVGGTENASSYPSTPQQQQHQGEDVGSLCTASMVSAYDLDGNGFVDQIEFLQLLTQLMHQAFENCPVEGATSGSNSSSATIDTTPSVTDLLETLDCMCLPFHTDDEFLQDANTQVSLAAWNCCRRMSNGRNFAAPGIYDQSYDNQVCAETDQWVQSHVQRACGAGESTAFLLQLLGPLLDLDIQGTGEDGGDNNQTATYSSTTGNFIHGTTTNNSVFKNGTTNAPSDVPLGETHYNFGVVVTLPIVILFMIFVVFVFMRKRRRRKFWKVKREDLEFGYPPEVIGRGTFGLVVLAEYQGALVAVKRIRPTKRKKSKKCDGQTSGGNDNRLAGDLSSSARGAAGSSKTRATIIQIQGKQFDSVVLKSLKHDFIKETRYLARLRHPCIAGVVGAVIDKDEPFLVMEYLDRGSLHDLLHNPTVKLVEGDISVLLMLEDVIHGLTFLHGADPQVIHGDLKAANVLVDAAFRAKVADFGFSQKNTLGEGLPFWTAPELLRGEAKSTTASDVYAFGMILYEVFSRRDPFEGESVEEVTRQVKDKAIHRRPPVPAGMSEHVRSIMSDCLEYDTENRPTLEEVETRLKRIERSSEEHFVEVDQVSLYNTFPRKTAEALMAGESIEPDYHDCATIIFSDIIGFEDLSARLPPEKMANLLHRLYAKFDKLSVIHDVFKVDTIGNAYMAVANVAKEQPEDHAKRIAEFSIAVVAAANNTYVDEKHKDKGCVNVRCGIHSGPVVAEVIGRVKPQYCLFGDTVNSARRMMESNNEVNRIHCSKRAAKLLQMQSEYLSLSFRGRTPIKGIAEMDTFWVNEGAVIGKKEIQDLGDSVSSFLNLELGEMRPSYHVRSPWQSSQSKPALEPLAEASAEFLEYPGSHSASHDVEAALEPLPECHDVEAAQVTVGALKEVLENSGSQSASHDVVAAPETAPDSPSIESDISA